MCGMVKLCVCKKTASEASRKILGFQCKNMHFLDHFGCFWPNSWFLGVWSQCMNKAATGNYYEHIHFCERSSALIFVHWEFKKLGEMKAPSEANRNFWHIWQSAFIFFALWIPKIGWNEDGERSEPKFLTYLAQICILALSKIFHPENFITTSNVWAPSEAGPRGPGPPPPTLRHCTFNQNIVIYVPKAYQVKQLCFPVFECL